MNLNIWPCFEGNLLLSGHYSGVALVKLICTLILKFIEIFPLFFIWYFYLGYLTIDFIYLNIPGKSGFNNENMFYLMLNKTYIVDGLVKHPTCHGTFDVGELGCVIGNVMKLLHIVFSGH